VGLVVHSGPHRPTEREIEMSVEEINTQTFRVSLTIEPDRADDYRDEVDVFDLFEVLNTWGPME
jgi:hypothetical protein